MRADTRLDCPLVCPIKSDGGQMIFAFLRVVAERHRVAAGGIIYKHSGTAFAPSAAVEMHQHQREQQTRHRRREFGKIPSRPRGCQHRRERRAENSPLNSRRRLAQTPATQLILFQLFHK